MPPCSSAESDSLVQRGGDSRLESFAPNHTRGPAFISNMAIQTGLILRTVFGLALRQTEGLIGSIIHLLGIELVVPDYSTLAGALKQ